MNVNEKTLFTTISALVNKEEAHLKSIGKGIFWMPELAIGYLLARGILADQLNIFGEAGIDCKREWNLGNGGPSDLVFYKEGDESKAVIEIKLRDTLDSYLSDYKKLARLEHGNYHKYFFLICDVFTNQEDGRIVLLNSYTDVANEIVGRQAGAC